MRLVATRHSQMVWFSSLFLCCSWSAVGVSEFRLWADGNGGLASGFARCAQSDAFVRYDEAFPSVPYHLIRCARAFQRHGYGSNSKPHIHNLILWVPNFDPSPWNEAYPIPAVWNPNSRQTHWASKMNWSNTMPVLLFQVAGNFA